MGQPSVGALDPQGPRAEDCYGHAAAVVNGGYPERAGVGSFCLRLVRRGPPVPSRQRDRRRNKRMSCRYGRYLNLWKPRGVEMHGADRPWRRPA